MTTWHETVLVLSETEWDDLAHICEVYRLEYESHPADDESERRLTLVRKIKDAAWGAP